MIDMDKIGHIKNIEQFKRELMQLDFIRLKGDFITNGTIFLKKPNNNLLSKIRDWLDVYMICAVEYKDINEGWLMFDQTGKLYDSHVFKDKEQEKQFLKVLEKNIIPLQDYNLDIT